MCGFCYAVCFQLRPPIIHNLHDTRALTAALFITVVKAVVSAVTAGPLRNAAVVRLAGELSVWITLVVWTHWIKKQGVDMKRLND